MEQQYLLAIDQGTTSTRAILFTPAGETFAVAAREHRQFHPAPGWVEHDGTEIWDNTVTVINDVLNENSVSAEHIISVGITNQRESVLLWDRATGEALTPVIVWQDQRTQPWLDSQGEQLQPLVSERAKLPLASYFSASKIRWLLQSDESLKDAASRGEVCAGTIDSWLLYKLTDGQIHATDVTNASRTMLFNIEDNVWDPQLCELFEIPQGILPRIKPSIGAFGTVSSPKTLSGAVITAILGDQQAAAFGQHAIHPGDTKNTYGTGCFLLQNTGASLPAAANGLIPTVAYQIQNQPVQYALEGSIAVAGSALQWLRDQVRMAPDTNAVVELAASVPDTGGVFFVPAFSGLYAPYWDPNARGLMIGLTGYTTNAHIIRAALESTAYQSVDVLEALTNATGKKLDYIKVDGGMAANDDLLQFQADLLDTPVQRPRVIETTAFGAALASGLGAGYFTSTAELADLWQLDHEFTPAMDPNTRAELLGFWHKAIERARGWLT